MARQIRNWEEQTAYSEWRKYVCWTQRAGTVKAVKRRTHKRERREATQEIATQIADTA